MIRSVSFSISCLISLKSVNILFLRCKKTPHSLTSLGTSNTLLNSNSIYNKIYRIQMVAINDNGQSDFSTAVIVELFDTFNEPDTIVSKWNVVGL